MTSKTHTKTNLVRTFFNYLVPYLSLELLVLLLMIIASAGSLATPYFLKIIIDDIFPKGNYTTLLNLLFLLVIIYIVRITCTVCTDVLYNRIGSKVVADMRRDMLINILNRPIGFFREARTGEILYTIMNDVENIQVAFSSLLLNLLNNLLTVLGIIIMLGILNGKLTLITLFIFPFVLFSIRKFTPHLQNSFRKIQQYQELLNDFFLEKIRNIRVVKTYATQSFEKGRLRDLQNKIVQAQFRNSLLNSFNSNITTFFIAIGPVVVLMYGGRGVFSGLMTLGSLIAFIQYLNRLYAPAVSIMESYNYFNRALVSMERVKEYIGDTARSAADEFIYDCPEFHRIDFKNVSLRLGEKWVLNNIDLTFQKGKIYGIIGDSGAGKSSIANLLCGLLPPSSGDILLDGSRSITRIAGWNLALGLIEKENQIFNATVLENIGYGTMGAGRQQILDAVIHSELNEVIASLQSGWDTPINETGTMLSDGQKQRISIARALLRRAPVIVFDEATAALDSRLEANIINNLRENYKDSVIVIITHRLNMLDKMDCVYTIAGGKAIGRNNSLLSPVWVAEDPR